MKRLLACLVVLLPLSWFAAGCGGSSSTPANSAPTKEQQDAMRKAQQEMMARQKQQK